MKVGNKIYNSIYGLKKIERNASSRRDRDSGDAFSVRNKSFADLQAKLQDMRQDETGFRNKLDPRIAIALNAANSDKAFALKSENDDHTDVDIVHDHSENRGKTTNIEV